MDDRRSINGIGRVVPLGRRDGCRGRCLRIGWERCTRSGATYGGKHEYSTCMQRPDHRRIDGCYRASNSLGGPIGRPRGVCAKERHTEYEHNSAQASLLASFRWKASALWQPESSCPLTSKRRDREFAFIISPPVPIISSRIKQFEAAGKKNSFFRSRKISRRERDL